MPPKIESIWISLAAKGFITPAEAVDQNTDVVATLATGERYVATFFTYQNIATLARKNRSTGEWLSGRYFWATDMLLVAEIDPVLIREVIDELISTDCWPAAFRLVAD